MATTDSFLQELEMEAQTTRRVLDRVPEDKLSWRPHAKSYSMGQLALHIASAIGQVSQMVTMESMEMPSFQQPEAASRQEILDALDESLKTARETLAHVDEAKLMTNLPIVKCGVAVMQMPRALRPNRASAPASVNVRMSGPSSLRIRKMTEESADSYFQSQLWA